MKKLLTVAFVALIALPAHAAQEGEALSPFAGNLGNAIWTVLIFVAVVVVLGKFAWGPVLSLLRDREDFILRSLSDAKRDRDDAEVRLKEYAAKLQSAHAEAVTIIETARGDAERLRQDCAKKPSLKPRRSSRTPSSRSSSRPRAACSRFARKPSSSP